MKLNFRDDQSKRTQVTPAPPRRPNQATQPHHQFLSGIRRPVGGAGPTDSQAGEYPPFGRRTAPGSRPDLRQRYLLRAAHRLPMKGVGRHEHLRFQEWAAAGVFLRLWQVGLERYDELKGLDSSFLEHGRSHNQVPPGRGVKPASNAVC